MKTLIAMLFTLTLCSCGVMNTMTNAELVSRNKIDYELDKLWVEYEYKRDSLIIEYNKH